MIKQRIGTIFVLLLSLRVLAQSHSAFPVDIAAGPAPQPLMADGQAHLVYELRLNNFSASPIELLTLNVYANNGTAPLASYHGDELEKLLVTVGPNDNPQKMRAIGGGRSVAIFLDLTLPAGTLPPAELRHQLSLSIPRKKDGSGGALESTINGLVVAVVQEPAPILQAPLRGSGWVAFNGLSNPNHRRARVPVDGKVRIAQRFAIDWMRVGPDGRLFHGDPKSNANFYSYGAEVLAVADGQVSDLTDGLPDNIGINEASSRNITLDNVVGNYVILDLGQKRFALYAHLKPGSLKVKVGDKVKAGQVLALLGNSGNSDAPHLHFHLVDVNSPLGAEGVPYVFESFSQSGVVDGTAMLDNGQSWQPKTGEKPIVHRRELPADNAVVTFP